MGPRMKSVTSTHRGCVAPSELIVAEIRFACKVASPFRVRQEKSVCGTSKVPVSPTAQAVWFPWGGEPLFYAWDIGF